ncbi:MAG: Zn-dependent hydrolase [Rhodospirillaceae bacterium]|jgi:beta-ureidopropionase / N-carbamoyl-L-amino-acid hydrolase|nr:Zn-dependent hydrolase [Rhodospirillaceae bacterium]MBT6118542.1 Zn-dependent hydrolase [Rhodospirillaceae bacterium]
MNPQDIAKAVDHRLGFAEDLFDAAAARTRDGDGITRACWSTEDQAVAEIFAEAARSLDLEVVFDRVGNVYATLPGRDRSAPGILSGSHLDSVPRGGNFDGYAGAVAGLTALAAFRDLGIAPPCDLTATGIRGEESVWYGTAYLGSRMAVGALPHDELDRLKRGDTGRSLGEHMAELGFDPDALKVEAEPHISPKTTKAFLELHIEQGPILIGEGIPVGIPMGIKGNARWPYGRCVGAYDHAAAVPRDYRRDAVLATVELIGAVEALWHEMEAEGIPNLVFTAGKLFTNPEEHAMTKIPGECDFALNFGATDTAVLDRARARIPELAAEIAARRKVVFDLGELVGTDPTPLDETLRTDLGKSAESLGIPAKVMATVGHDASIFQRAGIPSAMVLVRNEHGSHNAQEAMEMADFGLGVRVLAATMLARA